MTEEKVLIDEEMRYLQNEMLLLDILNEINASGVIGNEDTILVLINKVMLRLVKNAEFTSSNVIVSDYTGGGKDFITKKITWLLLPDGKLLHLTSVTPKFFNYYKPTDDTYDGMVLHMEDPDDDTLNEPTFKTLASGKGNSAMLIDQRVKMNKIKGKPVIIVTSMKQSIDIELLRRWDCVRVESGKRHNELVMKRISEVASGKNNYQPNLFLKSALLKLKPYKVVIPFAENIYTHISSNNSIVKTQLPKLFDYIKASAILHQYQRQRTPQDELIADACDLEYGLYCFYKLNDLEGQSLSRHEDNFINTLRKHGRHGSTVAEILSVFRDRGKDWIYDNVENLQERGLIYTEYHENDRGQNILYIFPSGDEKTWEAEVEQRQITEFIEGKKSYITKILQENKECLIFSKVIDSVNTIRLSEGVGKIDKIKY